MGADDDDKDDKEEEEEYAVDAGSRWCGCELEDDAAGTNAALSTASPSSPTSLSAKNAALSKVLCTGLRTGAAAPRPRRLAALLREAGALPPVVDAAAAAVDAVEEGASPTGRRCGDCDCVELYPSSLSPSSSGSSAAANTAAAGAADIAASCELPPPPPPENAVGTR